MDEARIIRNRDIPRLENVFCIMQEIVSLERRREWQHDRMTSVSCKYGGMPGGGGMPKGLDEAFAALSELDEKHHDAVKRYTRELKACEAVINGIESESMRAFVVMMYLDGRPAPEVREALNMTRWGFERARRAVEEARDMKSVVWHERYILAEKG